MISPLEPLHPDGRLERLAIVGSSCPPGLAPAGAVESEGALDAVIVAASAAEWHDPAPLGFRLRAAAARLTPDGLAYVLAPPRRRAWARKLLHDAGLELAPTMIHVPDVTLGRYLVPLERRAGTYAFSKVIPLWPYRRWLLRVALVSRAGRAILARVLGPVALVARTPRGRPLYDWLENGFAPRPEAVVTTRRGRQPEDRLALLVFARGDSTPTRVVKIRDAGVDRHGEAAALEQLGMAAGVAGAEVPSVLASARLRARSVLAETPVTGRSAAAALAARPWLLPDVLDRIAAWLERWNLETSAWVEPAEPVLERQIHAPLQTLDSVVSDEYRDWLLAKTKALAASRVCTVAAHNDLTMFNILVDRGRKLGIVDWEEASPRALPLTDLAYAAVDAVAAAERYRNRLEAFDATYGDRGRHRDRARALTRRLASSLDLTSDLVEMSFHACWLLHASNEVRERGRGSRGPFAQIIRKVMLMRGAG